MLLEGLPQVYALENRVLCIWVERARPGKELLKVVVLASFFATLATVHCCNGTFWLSFLVEIALILVRARVAITLLIVIITMREAIMLLFFLIGLF